MKKIILVKGKKVEINLFGNKGKDLILLPGWTHDFQYETKFVGALSKKHRVITVSYPGYSGSSENISSQKMKHLAYIVSKIVKELGLTKYTLIGFSMGSQVALHHKQQFNKSAECILLSPPLIPLDRFIPFYGRMILKLNWLRQFVRSSSILERLVVNKAYMTIPEVTRGIKKGNSIFKNDHVSFHGAFDTLIAMLSNFCNPLSFSEGVHLIFGDKEILQNIIKGEMKYDVIKDLGHGNFNKRYLEIANLINEKA